MSTISVLIYLLMNYNTYTRPLVRSLRSSHSLFHVRFPQNITIYTADKRSSASSPDIKPSASASQAFRRSLRPANQVPLFLKPLFLKTLLPIQTHSHAHWSNWKSCPRFLDKCTAYERPTTNTSSATARIV